MGVFLAATGAIFVEDFKQRAVRQRHRRFIAGALQEYLEYLDLFKRKELHKEADIFTLASSVDLLRDRCEAVLEIIDAVPIENMGTLDAVRQKVWTTAHFKRRLIEYQQFMDNSYAEKASVEDFHSISAGVTLDKARAEDFKKVMESVWKNGKV